MMITEDHLIEDLEVESVAGKEVESFSNIPLGMKEYVIPSGEYAVFTHKGELDKLGHTFNYIFGSWLPRSGRKLRNSPDFEYYDERFKLNQPDSELDLYIPLE